MKFLIDANLSMKWNSTLRQAGWESIHWFEVGPINAPDTEIMERARRDGRVVLTHDLDFGSMLRLTNAVSPSVVQVRTQDVRAAVLGPKLIPVLREHQDSLERGALLVVDAARSRIRLLPLRR